MDTDDDTIAMGRALSDSDLTAFKRMVEEDRRRLDLESVFGPWLHEAVAFGKEDFVEFLLDAGVDINRKGGIGGGNALKEAASEGSLKIVEYLLSRGAEMDTSGSSVNPLFSAIYGGHTAVAKLLIDRGIDTTVKYTGGRMKDMDAMAFAREWGRKEIVALLEAKQGPVAREPAVQVEPSPSTLDFALIRQLIRDAARKTIQELRAAHAEETLYSFVLYSDDGAMIVSPSANTEEQLCQLLENEQSRISKYEIEPSFYRWSPFEWASDGEGSDHFRSVYQAVNIKNRESSPEFGTFPEFKGRLFATMTLALKDLVAEGVFGTEEAGDRMTVFCSVCDSSLAPWLEVESARVLNPERVFRRFADELLADSAIRTDYELNCRHEGAIEGAYRRGILD